MANYTLPYFGKLDLENIQDYYSVTSELNERKISIDLNFEKTTITQDNITAIKSFLEQLEIFDKQNAGYIAHDLREESGETSGYLNLYLEEFAEDALLKIIDTGKESKSFKNQLLEKLKLIRVGLYPDGKYGTSYFAAFDHSIEIDGNPCNQLLVVKTNEKGKLHGIAWES